MIKAKRYFIYFQWNVEFVAKIDGWVGCFYDAKRGKNRYVTDPWISNKAVFNKINYKNAWYGFEVLHQCG